MMFQPYRFASKNSSWLFNVQESKGTTMLRVEIV